MKFKYLTEIGDHYAHEEWTPGERNNLLAWKKIETELKAAIVDLKRESKKTPSVKDLIKFHQSPSEQTLPNPALAIARRKIDTLRLWLSKEGAAADADGNIDLSKFANLVVEYDHSLKKQGMTRVLISRGQLLNEFSREPLDTTKMVTHFTGPGKAIFVMSKQGNLHVGSHVVGHYHHSSLLAGRKVSGAGELEVKRGQLMWLSNKSGHYRPGVYHLLQVLHVLQKNCVPMTFRLTVNSAGANQEYATVADFFAALDMNEEPDYELMKLMAYSQHLTDAVLNLNGWRWRSDPALEKAGVYDTNSGLPVPHKMVRQWLRSQGLRATKEVQRGTGR
jgi:hypothetical protein